MLLNELIQKLEDELKEHGNLEVRIDEYSGPHSYRYSMSVDIVEYYADTYKPDGPFIIIG